MCGIVRYDYISTGDSGLPGFPTSNAPSWWQCHLSDLQSAAGFCNSLDLLLKTNLSTFGRMRTISIHELWDENQVPESQSYEHPITIPKNKHPILSLLKCSGLYRPIFGYSKAPSLRPKRTTGPLSWPSCSLSSEPTVTQIERNKCLRTQGTAWGCPGCP